MQSVLLLYLWNNPLALAVTIALVVGVSLYFIITLSRGTKEEKNLPLKKVRFIPRKYITQLSIVSNRTLLMEG